MVQNLVITPMSEVKNALRMVYSVLFAGQLTRDDDYTYRSMSIYGYIRQFQINAGSQINFDISYLKSACIRDPSFQAGKLQIKSQ